MSADKQALYSAVDSLANELIDMCDFIHANPELGNEEFKAHKLLIDTLEQAGFKVDKNILDLPTAFIAEYAICGGGPRIGLLCEYDALPELGHACGHNMQGPAIIGAALALVQTLRDVPATIVVYGTPAEETTSGKLPMAKAGLFDNLDIALMMHGSDSTTVDGKSLALNLVDFNFTGKSAHAAISPEKGISALDAVLLMFNGIEFLREHVRSDVRVHGIITDGGTAANIVPAHASAQFYIRANDRPHLNTVVERVYNIARGAAMMVGATLDIQEVKAYDNKFNVPALNKLVLDNAQAAGATGITPPREKTGSTDFSCVTYRVPGACLRIKMVPTGTASHTTEFAQAANSPVGHQAVIITAKALAATAFDVISCPDTLAAIKSEFAAAQKSLG